VDELAADVEAEAGAADAARHVRVEAVELLEDPALLGERDAEPLIEHAELQPAAPLLEREDDLDEAQRMRLLRMIEQESDHLAQIVDQLLVTAQIDRGRLRLDESDCDVAALCASVLDAAETRKPESIRLELLAPRSTRPLRCDSPRLKQVLVNLVENAIKYSPNGGRIQVRIADAPDKVRIQVTDEGLGIPPSEQSRIFEKFYRLDAEMTRGVGGSGLGLYISREIVEQMGGVLSVNSRRGSGSTFTVILPRSVSGAPSRAERQTQSV